ncbi:pollen-specific leucine-rich repeat extensin-like protein 1 [Nilaparvata lugens]|uniref:pollen-specific leucine-rich repeat extensin-like protein 1 n=1 Tax=Nilaparvata lugens TaxID=108931 RepID=UPI00193DCE91|nr:pollen-specific leucine-rich repeat extensin-like protein 1 [Nilaparvata lugens]
MVYDVNLIATLLLGWTAMCYGKMMDNADEPKSVIKEYKAGNLNEKLTIDHVTYDNPRGATKKAKLADREEGRSVTLNLNRDDDDDDDDEDDSPPTTMLTEPSSLKPIGMRRPVSTSPEPTIPEDLLREVSLMKIPQYDLPKTITSIRTQPLKSFKDDFPSYENDDIMKPEYSKYFNDDYQVPVEYQKFNFKSQLPKDDTEKHVKIEIGKTKVKTIVDEPIIITKTKLIDYNTLEGSTTPDTYTSYYHDHYRNVHKDKVRAGCYNCYGGGPMYNPPMYKPRLPYPPPPRPLHYPLGSPYIPRYAPRYARSRYVRPVYRPTVMRYPPPRHLHYRPPYRRPRPVYLPRPPRIHPPYWYPPPPPHHPPPPPPPPPRVPPPKPSCPPSKVVKEVHVHHFPTPSKIEKIPVPVAILEANHDENYEHDSIIEPGPYDEEGLDSDEHAELQEINAHLDEALRNNKKELDKNLENGQRYIIEQEDKDRGGTGSGSNENEYKKPNYNKVIDQALVKNRKELEKNLKDGPDIVKTAYLPDDGIYNLHKFADKNHLYNFPVKTKSKGQKTSSSSNANDYKLHVESLKDFEPRKILHDGTPIRYILTNKMSYNHTKPQEA